MHRSRASRDPCPVNLTGTNWTLTYYTNEKGTMVPVTNGTDVTIRFGLENGTTPQRAFRLQLVQL